MGLFSERLALVVNLGLCSFGSLLVVDIPMISQSESRSSMSMSAETRRLLLLVCSILHG